MGELLMADQRYQCPRCHQSIGLWEGVEVAGWRSIGPTLKPERSGYPDRDVHWENATSDGFYGCAECEWEGVRDQLERIGIDGLPLRKPIRGQMAMASDDELKDSA